MQLHRTNITIKPDSRRVLLRPFEPGRKIQTSHMVERIMALAEEDVQIELQQIMTNFEHRHRDLTAFFRKRFEQTKHYLPPDQNISELRKLLFGACFSMEYSTEAAALFNPSMVWHPDQTNLHDGSKRFILSLRSTGEGHISSISFQSGVIDRDLDIRLDDRSQFVTSPEIIESNRYEKNLFEKKLAASGILNDFTSYILTGLKDNFGFDELNSAVQQSLPDWEHKKEEFADYADKMLCLAQANYQIRFPDETDLTEQIIFPISKSEKNGIEDARFVCFMNDDGSHTYYATYTAYDGKAITSQLLETADFQTFNIHTLHGSEVQNKGMALFPRKINGRYAMLSRQDNEQNFIMFSDHLHYWNSKQAIMQPEFHWECIQLGNCGSPIETEAGWVVLTHGVRPMRSYSISAILLDLNDPAKIIGRLKEPLIRPSENEREGYVPNVVYSCGGVCFERTLIIPYAMSDSVSSIALVNIDDLVTELTL
ncbi:glycoside hydrolase family 130 protein [candidate division KSB1 bacterium]|nr:glycoside hydrolase family 130 protein [candidate division KSB1 bacterium]